jgi:hypothetical protein
MSGKAKGIPASQLARDYGASLKEFSDSIIGLIGKEWTEEATASSRRREICAAVSAAMLAALDASTLAREEREKVQPLLREVLQPFWSRHCGGDDSELATWMDSRAAHYLQGAVADSRVKSAVNLVKLLLDALDAPPDLRTVLTERLVPAFAHRMVGDVYRINEVRRKHGIELSLLATIGSLLQLSLSCGPILWALRMV